jgi:hypothetical protein
MAYTQIVKDEKAGVTFEFSKEVEEKMNKYKYALEKISTSKVTGHSKKSL